MTEFYDRSTGDYVKLGGSFNPEEGNYQGSAYQFQKQAQSIKGAPGYSGPGVVRRVKKNAANMSAQFYAKDLKAQDPGSYPTERHQDKIAPIGKFIPNDPGGQMGSWN